MKHYAGLDVSVKETSICIVDEAGRICREMKVVSHPEDLLAVLCDPAWRLERVGLEAGPLSQWLFSGLAEAGVPAICIETRHAKAFLKAQVNKSDRNDARGIAQMMPFGERLELAFRIQIFEPLGRGDVAFEPVLAILAMKANIDLVACSLDKRGHDRSIFGRVDRGVIQATRSQKVHGLGTLSLVANPTRMSELNCDRGSR